MANTTKTHIAPGLVAVQCPRPWPVHSHGPSSGMPSRQESGNKCRLLMVSSTLSSTGNRGPDRKITFELAICHSQLGRRLMMCGAKFAICKTEPCSRHGSGWKPLMCKTLQPIDSDLSSNLTICAVLRPTPPASRVKLNPQLNSVRWRGPNGSRAADMWLWYSWRHDAPGKALASSALRSSVRWKRDDLEPHCRSHAVRQAAEPISWSSRRHLRPQALRAQSASAPSPRSTSRIGDMCASRPMASAPWHGPCAGVAARAARSLAGRSRSHAPSGSQGSSLTHHVPVSCGSAGRTGLITCASLPFRCNSAAPSRPWMTTTSPCE
mmetsp:Transcript_113318/g.321275  ORF Transcript_113318/g.321275 Transcript_113318/m.321275 type:complete len:323 (+) Transcript_113318:181-1149(+)